MDPAAQKRMEERTLNQLESKALAVARNGGMYFTLLSRLTPIGDGRWRLESNVLCTHDKVAGGRLTAEGATSRELARRTLQLAQKVMNADDDDPGITRTPGH